MALSITIFVSEVIGSSSFLKEALFLFLTNTYSPFLDVSFTQSTSKDKISDILISVSKAILNMSESRNFCTLLSALYSITLISLFSSLSGIDLALFSNVRLVFKKRKVTS